MIDGIRVPRCDCPPNTGGDTCQILSCGGRHLCYNGSCGGIDNAICQCYQEDGIAKYHGASCDMPAACQGNPCQNGGICTAKTQTGEIQVCFANKSSKILFL